MDENTEPDWQHLQPWLTLFHVDGLGPVRSRLLLAHFGSPEAVLSAGVAPLKAMLGNKLATAVAGAASRPSVQEAVERDRLWQASSALHHILSQADSRYPSLLKAIVDPPLLVYVKGDPKHLVEQQLAIVGSRKASAAALQTARRVAAQISSAGVTVTSGLARGIDTMAHRGALEQGGSTIAVLASGIDLVYPGQNTQLAQSIGEQGALVSEFSLGTRPVPGHFPRRNRIISGLSQGVLVVEAGMGSGSLITARYALEQGRDVLAMPGCVNNPGVRGCHALIRDGACLVENAEQILQEMQSCLVQSRCLTSLPEQVTCEPDCPEQKRLWALMGFEPCHPDELVLRSGLSSQEVARLLLDMEMAGLVQQTPAGIVRTS